jgi:hypothetical protein
MICRVYPRIEYGAEYGYHTSVSRTLCPVHDDALDADGYCDACEADAWWLCAGCCCEILTSPGLCLGCQGDRVQAAAWSWFASVADTLPPELST